MNKQTDIKLVLFDLDGTLANTYADLSNALQNSMLDAGLPVFTDDNAVKAGVSNGAHGMVQAALSSIPLTPEQKTAEFAEQLKDKFLARYEANVHEYTHLFDGAEALLDALEKRDILWGIVTNKRERFTLPLVKSMALDKRAACVVCGDTTPHFKPHPAPLLLALKQTKIQPHESIYLGDAEKDMQAAQAANMPGFVAAWGYLFDNHSHLHWPANGILQNPIELLDVI